MIQQKVFGSWFGLLYSERIVPALVLEKRKRKKKKEKKGRRRRRKALKEKIWKNKPGFPFLICQQLHIEY